VASRNERTSAVSDDLLPFSMAKPRPHLFFPSRKEFPTSIYIGVRSDKAAGCPTRNFKSISEQIQISFTTTVQ
jgi:hypothetical protein